MEELLKYGNKLHVTFLEQYKSNNHCKEFVNFIVKIIKDEVVTKVTSSKFCSVFIDGGTEKSVTEQITLRAKCLKHGKVNDFRVLLH
jgi:hypothetical protein